MMDGFETFIATLVIVALVGIIALIYEKRHPPGEWL